MLSGKPGSNGTFPCPLQRIGYHTPHFPSTMQRHFNNVEKSIHKLSQPEAKGRTHSKLAGESRGHLALSAVS